MSALVKLKPHQQAVVDYLDKQYGLLVYHSTGSGKTITALVVAVRNNKPTVIIGPKSSKKAFYDEMIKMKFDIPYEIYSYKKMSNIITGDSFFFEGKTVIVDEAHHLRSDNYNNKFLFDALRIADKLILLTATPILNYLSDIAPLVNAVSKNDDLSPDHDTFNFLFYNQGEITNVPLLKKKLTGYISYYSNKSTKDYPRTKTITTEIEMTNEQFEEYKNYLYKHLESHDLDISFLRPAKRNIFLNVTRQLSNTIEGSPDFPKYRIILDHIMDEPKPAIVYSNFLNNGTNPLMLLLIGENISFKKISGTTSESRIMEIAKTYNEGKFDVLLISSAASEGLDLKNTRQIHVMEPHWNEAKIDQVVGRAIRYKSHESLKVEDRNVVIYRYLSIFPKGIGLEEVKTADQHLTELCIRKSDMLKKFNEIVEMVSI